MTAVATKAGRRRANKTPKPPCAVPAPSVPEAASPLKPRELMLPESATGEGLIAHEIQVPVAMPTAVSTLRELQSQRVATIRMQLRITNAVRALARRALGWRMDAPEAERAAVNKAAAELVEALESGKAVAPEHAGKAAALLGFVLAARDARKPFDTHRDAVEKKMRALAQSLPVWAWAEGVKGFGELGLAIIVGEAGDLSDYANPGKLWKRLGLAPPDAYAVDRGNGPVREIPKRRRSAIWTVADSLFKAKNPYTDLYRGRRLYECQQHPEFDKGTDPKTGKRKVTMHCDRRSRRYAEKRLILDLWVAWNKALAR